MESEDSLEELDLEQVRIYEELYDVPELTTDEAYDIAEDFPVMTGTMTEGLPNERLEERCIALMAYYELNQE